MLARPRKFELETALDGALETFWRLGYDGASITALTEAMGLNAPSLYAAFGGKRQLFTKILDRYDEKRATVIQWMLDGTSAHDVACRALFTIVDRMTEPSGPNGCLLLQAGVSAATAADVPATLMRRRADVEKRFKQRFEVAKLAGDLSDKADPDSLAHFIAVAWDGIGVQAAAGVPREKLRRFAFQALDGLFPGMKGEHPMSEST